MERVSGFRFWAEWKDSARRRASPSHSQVTSGGERQCELRLPQSTYSYASSVYGGTCPGASRQISRGGEAQRVEFSPRRPAVAYVRDASLESQRRER